MKKMIVALTGGLGNQMFQYAFSRVLKEQWSIPIEFDTHFYEEHREWNIGLSDYAIEDREFADHVAFNKIRLVVQRLPIIRWIIGTYKECREYAFDLRVFKWKYRFYAGYWQNIRYLTPIRERLRNELRYSGDLSEELLQLSQEIRNGNTIAVHVRRGDYMSPMYKGKYYILDEDYYRRAILKAEAIHSSKGPIDKVYFFSNDINWCIDTFSDIENAVFIDGRISQSEHTDLYLMQQAKILIMANSTFSWWAAWLSDREERMVIAPKNWYYDKEKNERTIKALLDDAWITCE